MWNRFNTNLENAVTRWISGGGAIYKRLEVSLIDRTREHFTSSCLWDQAKTYLFDLKKWVECFVWPRVWIFRPGIDKLSSCHLYHVCASPSLQMSSRCPLYYTKSVELILRCHGTNYLFLNCQSLTWPPLIAKRESLREVQSTYSSLSWQGDYIPLSSTPYTVEIKFWILKK